MKLLSHIVTLVLAAACAGTVCAQMLAPYPDRVIVAQRRVLVRTMPPGAAPVHQRRFVMPPGGVVYQRGVNPQFRQYPVPAHRAPRMTIEERRALRRQINEANRDMYRNNRGRGVYPHR